MPKILIRKANIEDANLILGFIKELARHEKAEEKVIASVEDIENNFFNNSKTIEAIICTYDNIPIGFAVYFLNFSTWLGKNGLYLEDLYVSPSHRGTGAGMKLLKHLVALAIENNYGRIDTGACKPNCVTARFKYEEPTVPRTQS